MNYQPFFVFFPRKQYWREERILFLDVPKDSLSVTDEAQESGREKERTDERERLHRLRESVNAMIMGGVQAVDGEAWKVGNENLQTESEILAKKDIASEALALSEHIKKELPVPHLRFLESLSPGLLRSMFMKDGVIDFHGNESADKMIGLGDLLSWDEQYVKVYDARTQKWEWGERANITTSDGKQRSGYVNVATGAYIEIHAGYKVEVVGNIREEISRKGTYENATLYSSINENDREAYDQNLQEKWSKTIAKDYRIAKQLYDEISDIDNTNARESLLSLTRDEFRNMQNMLGNTKVEELFQSKGVEISDFYALMGGKNKKEKLDLYTKRLESEENFNERVKNLPEINPDTKEFPPGSQQLNALIYKAVQWLNTHKYHNALDPQDWVFSPHMHTLVSMESGGKVGALNYTMEKNRSGLSKEQVLEHIRRTGTSPINSESSATGLGQLLLKSGNVGKHYPTGNIYGQQINEAHEGVGRALPEMIGMVDYIYNHTNKGGRYMNPRGAWEQYGMYHEGY